MKILMVEPGKAPEEKNISGTLDSMQEAVGGTIQAIYPFDEPVALICNDDGKLMNLPMCRSIYEIGDVIFGSFFVCAAPPGHRNFASLRGADRAIQGAVPLPGDFSAYRWRYHLCAEKFVIVR